MIIILLFDQDTKMVIGLITIGYLGVNIFHNFELCPVVIIFMASSFLMAPICLGPCMVKKDVCFL